MYSVETVFGYTPVYYNIQDYGWTYFFFSIFIMSVLNDTSFYWAHRFMHWRPVFIRVHALHHTFTDVNAFTGYSIHIFESLIEGIFVAFLPNLLFPWHPAAFFLYSTFSLSWSTYLHCGYELVPENWKRRKPFDWIYSSTHHFMHHQKPGCNFSLWYTFWDRLMGTESRE